MQKKLGQLLIGAGLITSEQLEEALKNQVIFGGRLGTNLIELEYLNERQIARLLSTKLGVPAADRDQLRGIAPELTSLIPIETVKKYQALPIRLEGKRLTIAMADPSDLKAIDELGFLSGCIIIPLVAPELLLMNAMEHYYGLKRETRFIPVAREVRNQARQKEASHESESFKPAAAPFGRTAETIDLPTLPVSMGFDDMGDPLPESAIMPGMGTGSSTSDPWVHVCTRLADATERDSIARELLRFLESEFSSAALLQVKGDFVTGWMGRHQGKEMKGIDQLFLPLADSPALSQAISAKQFHMGPLVSEGEKKAYLMLGGTRPKPVLLVPITLANRVVAVMSLSDTLETLTKGLTIVQKLAAKAGLAFEILILRNKILML